MLLRKIDRYLALEVLATFMITLLAFTGLLFTVKLLSLASLIINKGVSVGYVLKVALAILPTFLEISLPFAALIGTMISVSRLSVDSEIIVLRASGMSIYNLARPLLLIAAALTVITLFISSELRPWGYNTLSQTLFEIASSRSTASISPGIFSDLGNITLYTDELDDARGLMRNVLIDDRRDPSQRKVVFADQGLLISDETERTLVVHLKNGVVHEIQEKNYLTTKFFTNSININFSEIQEDPSGRNRKLRELYGSELTEMYNEQKMRLEELRAINSSLAAQEESMEDQHKDPMSSTANLIMLTSSEKERREALKNTYKQLARIKTEKTLRISMPLATAILTILGFALGIQVPRLQRNLGAGASIITGFIVFMFYYGMLSFAITLAEGGKLAPNFALWLPNVVIAVLTAYFVHMLSKDNWISVVSGLADLCLFWLPRKKFF
ncbi:MAG TPA: LptF/LptG family permease [Oligoflexia bacterium]|nr:LptF/LptG family permease [Oligoflexia bacterium]HMP27171.1 LptF/LptG family permease [Oligoflexia bacterium]